MGEFSKDELKSPNWMNRDFFQEVLVKYENNDSVKITDLITAPGTTKGEHFASVMFRAKVTYDTKESKGKTLSMIIKTMPESEGMKKDMLQDSYIFETEIAMYSETIPKFEAELRKAGDQTVLGVKALYYSLKPRKCIIFEDITLKGYETLQTRLGNMTEVKAAFLKLAKWHAVSYKLASEGDTSVTDYKEAVLNMKGSETMPFIAFGMKNLIETLETIDELKEFVPKLRLMEKDLVKRCVASTNTYRQKDAKGIFVLCHGDFHGKNMMFKTDKSGNLQDVMLIDFQVCFFGPAVLDVLYGLYMLLDHDLRINHREELIYYYITNFIETLEKLKFQGEFPKVSDFYIDILRHRNWEMFLVSTFLPMCYAFYQKDVDVAEVLTSDDARKKIYDHPDFITEMKRLLPILLHQGYLESF